MRSSPSRRGAYGPLDAVLKFLTKLRDGHVTEPVAIDSLIQLGVARGNSHRTLASLRFLGLVNADGSLTAEALELAKAPTGEYQEVLSRVVNQAYWEVFEAVNPVDATDFQMKDAFRHFTPGGRWDGMLTLFRGLCREAGILPGGAVPQRQRHQRDGATAGEDPPGVAGDVIASVLRQLPANQRWTAMQRAHWLKLMEAAVDWTVTVRQDGAGDPRTA